MKTKVLGLSSRHWAVKPIRYQNFWGRYRLHECGLWFSDETSDALVEQIARAFFTLPRQLQEVARQYELTISVSNSDFTAAGNSATTYGDWSARTPQGVSPHVEFGQRALDHHLRPYFAHELAHLWWKTRTEDERRAYTSFLDASTALDDIEVTPYVHNTSFSDFVEYISKEDNTRSAKNQVRVTEVYRKQWVEESFCDTVARLWVPAYPFSGTWKTTVDLELRRAAILSTTGLQLTA